MEDFIAGWFGGCAGVVVGQPMDTVKVRMQATDVTKQLTKSNSFNKVFFKTLKNESVSGFFKGMLPPLSAVAFQNAVLFGIYGNTLKHFESGPDGSYSASQIAVAGSAAGFAQLWIVCPLELIKIKLQMQTEAKRNNSFYHGPMDCIKKIYKVRGIPGFYQGMCITMFRDVPGFGVYFGAYELLSLWLVKYLDHNSPLVTLLSGGFAGVISWASTFPLDVTKSRFQADGNRGNFKYSGIVDCMVKSYRAEGLGVFTRGLLPTVLRAFPCNAAIFYVYNFFINIFHKNDLNFLSEEGDTVI